MMVYKNEPPKICILHFGQVGDVIMSFAALAAIRKRFPEAEITFIGGKTPAALVADLTLTDRVIEVDRHALLNGPKSDSIKKIFKLVGDVRREKFDLVIDLHSLRETNLLGFLSGAKHRLFGRRRNRSLDLLSNYRPRPIQYDPEKHLSDIYIDVILPLGISDVESGNKISVDESLAAAFVRTYCGNGKRLVGLAIGAGNQSRRWELEKFVELARLFKSNSGNEVIVFLGPEEERWIDDIRSKFEGTASVAAGLSLLELAAAASTLNLFIGNDTGTTHLAVATGVPVIAIVDERAPPTYFPSGKNTRIIRSETIENISVDEVWKASVELLEANEREFLQRKTTRTI
jgi:ADP-heptose:LPS heptosyltransferase